MTTNSNAGSSPVHRKVGRRGSRHMNTDRGRVLLEPYAQGSYCVHVEREDDTRKLGIITAVYYSRSCRKIGGWRARAWDDSRADTFSTLRMAVEWLIPTTPNERNSGAAEGCPAGMEG